MPQLQTDELTDAPPDSEAVVASDAVAISVRELGKRFRLYRHAKDRLLEWLTPWAGPRHEPFWALKDVSFEVSRGESLGIIGVNGSGKSTLLKILSGALHSTQGTYQVAGRVLSLLELGTGLNSDLTARQNIVTSAQILGFPAGYAQERIEQIEDFAELQSGYFDRPIRLYSSGMLVRVVFSMFACFDPDVFVIDEALSVGDIVFQQKCTRRLRQMKSAGVTLLFVSHDLAAVETLCDRVMVLDKGRVKFLGDKEAGLQTYYSLVGAAGTRPPRAMPPRPMPAASPSAESDQSIPWLPPDESGQIGTGELRVDGICYQREDQRYVPTVEQGQWLTIRARLGAQRDVGPVNIGIGIYDRFGQLLFSTSLVNALVDMVWLKATERVIASFRLRLDLEPGEYMVWIGASEPKPDPSAPRGWSQHYSGERFLGLPHAGKIAVLARSDNTRSSFGPANLPFVVERVMAGATDSLPRQSHESQNGVDLARAVPGDSP
jgi:lipopolysaccharide transport system ATP-binding protein